MTDRLREALVEAEFNDGAGVAYTIAKLRDELNELYHSPAPKNAPKKRAGVVAQVGPSVIGRLQQIDHLQRYQIACLERRVALLLNPPKHKYWGAGEPDCPREIKAGNGELHTLRCKVCGQDDPRDDFCRSALSASPAETEAASEAMIEACKRIYLAGHSEGWSGNQMRRDAQHIDAEKAWNLYVKNGALEAALRAAASGGDTV